MMTMSLQSFKRQYLHLLIIMMMMSLQSFKRQYLPSSASSSESAKNPSSFSPIKFISFTNKITQPENKR